MKKNGLAAECLSYQKNGHLLVQRISHLFQPGKLYGILGPNGAGKSTLFRILSGLIKPTMGAVYWQDSPLKSRSRKEVTKIISLVPQGSPVYFDFTLLDLVAMGRYAHHRNGLRKEDQEVIERVLYQVDAWHLRDCPLSQLSCGERQRAYLARSLVSESPVLLLDEPTNALDLRHQLEMWQIIHALIEEGKIVLVAIHDLDAARQYCDELLVLNEGECVSAGSPSAALCPATLKTVFGVTQADRGYRLAQSRFG